LDAALTKLGKANKADDAAAGLATMTTLADALQSDETKGADPAAVTTMRATAADLREFVSHGKHGTTPSRALTKKLATDESTLFRMCE